MEQDKKECFLLKKVVNRRHCYYCGSKKYIFTEFLANEALIALLACAVLILSGIFGTPAMMIIGLILLFSVYTAIFIINKKEEARLLNPQLNPEGYKYQGRKLSENHPHVRMHLRNYEETDRMSLTQEERNIYRASGLYEGEGEDENQRPKQILEQIEQMIKNQK